MAIPVHIQPRVFSLPIMTAMSKSEVELLTHQLDYQQLKVGELLFEEGTPGTQCFLIIEGSILVSKRLESGEDQVLATLERGELLGQIALIDRKPRSATCRAGQAGVTLVAMSVENFETLYSAKSTFAYKILDHIVTDLSKRLRGANQQLSQARNSTDKVQRQRLSLKAAQVIAGHRYTDEELNAIEVIKTDFEQAVRYQS